MVSALPALLAATAAFAAPPSPPPEPEPALKMLVDSDSGAWALRIMPAAGDELLGEEWLAKLEEPDDSSGQCVALTELSKSLPAHVRPGATVPFITASGRELARIAGPVQYCPTEVGEGELVFRFDAIARPGKDPITRVAVVTFHAAAREEAKIRKPVTAGGARKRFGPLIRELAKALERSKLLTGKKLEKALSTGALGVVEGHFKGGYTRLVVLSAVIERNEMAPDAVLSVTAFADDTGARLELLEDSACEPGSPELRLIGALDADGDGLDEAIVTSIPYEGSSSTDLVEGPPEP